MVNFYFYQPAHGKSFMHKELIQCLVIRNAFVWRTPHTAQTLQFLFSQKETKRLFISIQTFLYLSCPEFKSQLRDRMLQQFSSFNELLQTNSEIDALIRPRPLLMSSPFRSELLIVLISHCIRKYSVLVTLPCFDKTSVL